MPDPNDQQLDPNGAPAATDQGNPAGIVDDLPEWKKALESISDPALKEKLNNKIKAYDQKLTKELTNLARQKQEIAQHGQTLKEAVSKATSPGSDATKAEKLKVLDTALRNATTSEEREGIRNLREAIKDELPDVQKLKDEILEQVRSEFSGVKQTTHSIKMSELSKDKPALVNEYGSDIVDKFWEQIEDRALKYPEYSAEQWLHTLAKPDELRQAMRIRLKQQLREESEGKNGSEHKKPDGPKPPVSTRPAPNRFWDGKKGPAGFSRGLGEAVMDSLKEVRNRR